MLPYSSLSPRVCSPSCPLSQWCYLTISSSVTLFFFCPQSFPESGSFPISGLFSSSGQSIGVSASALFLAMNIQGWYPLGLTDLIPLLSKRLSKVYTMEYYSAIKKNTFESVLMRWMKLEPIIQSEVSQKEKHQYSILTHIYGIYKEGNNNPVYETAKETLMYRSVLWTLWERERVRRFERMALKHV